MKKHYLILLCLIGACQTNEKSDLTFQSDIGPIFWKNCSSCHNPDGAGPFSLISYSDVKKKAKTIKEVINSGYMPPWPADTALNSFVGEKKLRAEEIKLISNWIESGAPENKTAEYKTWENTSATKEPDLVLKLPQIQIAGNNQDQFYLMKVPFELPDAKVLKLAVLQPGNPKLVHHCDAQLVNYEEGKKKNLDAGIQSINVNDYENYQAAFLAMDLQNDDGSYPALSPGVMHYLPGSEWQTYPKEIGGFSIQKKGVFLINQMHYGPSAIDALDQSEIHLYFTEEQPKRKVKELVLGSGGLGEIEPDLIIPPHKKSTFRLKHSLSETITLLTINPHMHQLGDSFQAKLIKKNGQVKNLISIENWDFRWQNFYTYKTPIIAEKGDEILIEGIYDNTAENPFNPYVPPQMVDGLKGSMKSSDEMFQFSINYMDYEEGDEKINLDLP